MGRRYEMERRRSAGAGDVVVIDRPSGNFVVTVSTMTAAVGSLYATEQLVVTGTLTLAGKGSLDGGVSLAGGLTGGGSVALGGPMTWTTGTIALGGLDVGVGQTLTVSTTQQHVLGTGALRNHGIVTWTGGTVYIQGTSTILNASDGVWEAQGDQAFSSSLCGTPTFTNAGTLRKTAGNGELALGSGGRGSPTPARSNCRAGP